MVDFIKFKEIFASWSYTKDEIDNLIEAEAKKVKYNNGRVFFIDETGVDFVKRELKVFFQDSMSHQELMTLEFEANYPVSSIDYLYTAHALFHRVACDWSDTDWEYVEEDYDDILEDKKIILIVYIYNPQILDFINEDFKKYVYNIYEISSGEYKL